MTLPGGPAAKLGHRYEKWWTIAELVRMLRGDTESLRIEPPGLDGVEFVVDAGSHQEFHQAKRSHRSGKWSLAMLDSEGVLSCIGRLLTNEPRRRFVFVSGSDARELSDLSEAARDAESLEEFNGSFLAAKQRRSGYERLLGGWHCDERTAWGLLRRIDVRTIGEDELDKMVRWGLSALFLRSVDAVRDRLSTIADDATHSTIERSWLERQLMEAGFPMRRVSSAQGAKQAVATATERYIQGSRRELIHGSLIPRDGTDEVLNCLLGERSGHCVLTGPAGYGKTGWVLQIAQELKRHEAHVLAFRLDRHMAATSTVELGRRLGLEESPALVLHTAAKASEAEGVMIVDQLDAVRTMSGRGTEVFDVVEKLLIEAEDCSIATLVVCRAFDWQHDPRLRSLIRDERRRFELGQLSPDDVQHALNKAGFNDGSFGSRQLDLLRVPQNLSLFLNSNSPRSPTFSTVGDLLERYWDQKREQVHARAQGEGDLWPEVLGAMCRAMNKTQQLTVRRERLDHYSPSYLHQLVSEGVLAREGEEYAFGHESFFDYCFARLFANNAQSLTELLRSSEQHLFRRSQVRQVLAYLRDADFDRYLRELRSLVLDPGVRAHVKDLAFALLAGVEEPYDKEWEIWEACFGTQLVAFGKETTASDPLRRLAWNRLFGARSWFKQFGKRGVLDRSLREQEADDATHYLKRHQCSWPDEVTDYLERFAGRGGAWLADVMLDVGSCGSRRYFELFLRLLANGTFDLTDDVGFRGGLSYVYYSLHGRDLQWVPELLAGQLLRLGSWFQAGVVSSEQPFDLLRDLPMEIIQDSARKAPSAFVSHVLPAMLDLADAASYKAQGLPFRDRMWPILVKNSPSEADACLETLAETIERLAGEGGLDGRWIGLLAARRTHIANHLLLAVYRGGSGRYADHAAQEFSRNPWRFDCGYSDSPYWCATEALAAVLPHCTEVAFARLEGMIVRYLSPYERTKEGASRRGEAAFNLLTAIPARRLSDSAKRRFQEMERKFGRRWSRPEGITGGIVGSPIPKESARRMSDEDWWNAMAKYGSASPADPAKRRHWRAGGAQELAHVLGEEAKAAPERFVDIGLGLPPDTNPMYYSGLLRALAGATLDDDAKLSFCRKVFQHAKTECGGDLADLLHTVSGPLPQDALDMLVALAVTPDGVEGEEEWRNEASDGRPFYGGDIYTNGINTTRGRAALAIGKLVVGDGTYVRRLEPSLHQLVGVGSASVASCVAYALRAVAYHDRDLGMALFLQMNFDEERLLATRHVREFIREHLHHGFRHMHELIGRMWRSVHPELRRSGARLGCMAAFHQEKARELVVPRGMWRTACMHMGRWTATALAMFF